MLLSDIKVFHNRFYKCIYNNSHGLVESDIIQFVHKAEIQFAYRFVIDIAPLCNRQHHISCKNNGYMGCQCIIGETPTLLYQMQIGFACLKKHLNVPAFSINTNDFFFWNGCIRADNGKPVLFPAYISNTDNLCWNCLVTNGYINGEQIPRASSAFFALSVDFFDVVSAFLITVLDFAAFLNHCDGIQSTVCF